MKKSMGISIAHNLDGSWRWELHVPKGHRQDYMTGFAKSAAEAEAKAEEAQTRYEGRQSM